MAKNSKLVPTAVPGAPARKSKPFVPDYLHLQRVEGGFILRCEREHHTDRTLAAFSPEQVLVEVEAWAYAPGKPPAAKR